MFWKRIQDIEILFEITAKLPTNVYSQIKSKGNSTIWFVLKFSTWLQNIFLEYNQSQKILRHSTLFKVFTQNELYSNERFHLDVRFNASHGS